MASSESATRSASRDRGPSSIHSTHAAAVNGDRGSVADGASNRKPDENRTPLSVPKGLGGMLKTTTETGDIGLFSIKPSRNRLPASNHRRASGPYQDDRPRQFQPYGVPNVDDRRRLPSYARDASSEVISMYETASQKTASRVFDDADYRSYSMTQTYPSYALSNHRSYTSLRSQPDAGGLLQRPRSPFAYPARLKRPGFRPSSPALTDGGVIDYSRRAEIDRMPYGANHHTSSPASLYAQKRRPQLSLRPEANRSTPSLLSQSSPQRRSPSSHTRHRSGTPSNDWQRRNGPASITTSPARSTLSLASTVNLYSNAHAASTTTTPGKIPPPSPLYYDYTEDFDIDDYNHQEPLEPPPQFRVDKTIPEDRPLSSAWTSLDGSDMPSRKPILNSILQSSTPTTIVLQKSREISQDLSMDTPSTSVFDANQTHSLRESTELAEGSIETAVAGDRKTVRLSGLGLGARELSTHVEEVFGLQPTTSFEILVSDASSENPTGDSNVHQESAETQPARNSSHSLNPHLSRFSPPLEDLDGHFSEPDSDPVLTLAAKPSLEHSRGLTKLQTIINESAMPTPEPAVVDVPTSIFPPRSSSLFPDRKRSSRSYTLNEGLTELDQLVNAFQESNRKKTERQIVTNRSQVFPYLPLTDAMAGSSSKLPSVTQANDTQSNFQTNTVISHEGLRDQGPSRDHPSNRPRRLEAVTIPTVSENDIANFSHRKLMTRSESPMLAPKPISPARQLRLKNSVPQLMKALPALPPDPTICSVPPPIQLSLSEVELPCQFSPLRPDLKTTASQEIPRATLENPVPAVPTGTVLDAVGQKSLSTAGQSLEQVQAEQKCSSPPLLPKLKLKMTTSATLRPMSPPESRPWNSADSYTWSSQAFNVGLPSIVPDDKPVSSKPPKFKLKITRASNSTVGTVRIHRESGDPRPSLALHLRHPKDLFTSNSGFDNIFRQVSKHLHSRRTSANSSYRSITRRSRTSSAPNSDQVSLAGSTSSHLISQPSQASLNTVSFTEARSFFSDDSSHRNVGGRRINRRISNLKARIASPYGVTDETQSHDDITWRTRLRQEPAIPVASRSIPDLHNGISPNEAKRRRRLSQKMHARSLRAKFTTWFKGATLAFKARVKPRRMVRRSENEQVQPVAVV